MHKGYVGRSQAQGFKVTIQLEVPEDIPLTDEHLDLIVGASAASVLGVLGLTPTDQLAFLTAVIRTLRREQCVTDAVEF